MISIEACPFCRIVADLEPARIVRRWNDATAFFPQNPATLGHLLVIPNDHFDDVWSLDSSTASRLSLYVLEIANAVKAALVPDGMNFINSNGAAATQTIFHVHIHVVPRWKNDRMGAIWPEDKVWKESDLDETFTSIARELGI
ncbi:HIT family protein [Amycolatopsis mediterranei]|uniref:HIT domain-containing protein n=1 Tax=Amycolatopsis mediterranei (strain S699) TaxID=713604 RepID=A0A9R0P288_AMYMS|nr:HIT domain-containing protein [Amycolatopsis mediterranei]AEK44812.1 hypothetical protein RAM_31685 [Amycolatopsis mediterranei S699]UZF72925.1 HIT domain-containing protein [Amycolatopsis mediterranei]